MWTEKEIQRIAERSKKHAIWYKKEGERYYNEGLIKKAKSHLIFSIEEYVKGLIASMHLDTVREKERVKVTKEEVHGPIVEESQLNNMTKKHEAKYVTMQTQLILGLLNTFEKEKRDRVMNAIKTCSAFLSPEVCDMLDKTKHFKKWREEGLYVDKGENDPLDRNDESDKRDYQSLLEMTKSFSESHTKFTSIKKLEGKPLRHSEVEKKIKKMCGRYYNGCRCRDAVTRAFKDKDGNVIELKLDISEQI